MKNPHSPGAMTAQRFFRSRLAVVGLGILAFMFLFSFLGGALSPYDQAEVFYRQELRTKAYASVTENRQLRFTPAPGETLSTVAQAVVTLGITDGKTEVSVGDSTYTITQPAPTVWELYRGGILVALAHREVLAEGAESFAYLRGALIAHGNGADTFTAEGQTYTLLPGQVSAYIVSPRLETETIDPGLRSAVLEAVAAGGGSFTWEGREFSCFYEGAADAWEVTEETLTRVWDAYSPPSRAHWLGTDKNGMDMLTRLMYGGRVSLVIGFLVVIIAAVLGVLLGGLAGYFGGWVDDCIMRLVDVFYCIPSTPLLIILGAAMDALRIEPRLRMAFLMLVLGLLGWPVIARLVRGQLLQLREQEFMRSAEGLGLGAGRRIFRHLLPNVIPQLMVTCTMSLGSTILTEATLSFLGLGVKFPFASWGNIMNDVTGAHVLTSYWFVWIPAGICLVLSVLGFNFVGDGLRDAFDPKSKN